MVKEFDLGENAHAIEGRTNTDVMAHDITPKGGSAVIQGLSAGEIVNPNSISVTITDNKTPIIVLFGPPSCGKTMTLIRLTRYLNEHGYDVSPDSNFRPSSDKYYSDLCGKYNEMVDSDRAALSTRLISFMLLKVRNSAGDCVCQILEAPGEHYFNPDIPEEPFFNYINSIINCKNRKIWLCMLEPDWKDQRDRSAYVNRISMLNCKIAAKDEVVFLYNKVDGTPFVIKPGHINMKSLIADVHEMYPGLFEPFKNNIPILSLFKSYNCDLMPYSNGDFTDAISSDGSVYKTWQPGQDIYPGRLWNSIRKKIRG